MTPIASALSLTQVGIRQQVCAECDYRSSVPPNAPTCAREGACSVFLLLPRICYLVGRYQTEPPCGYGIAVRNLLRHAEDSLAVAHDNVMSPLDRHAEATVAVVQQVLSKLRSESQTS